MGLRLGNKAKRWKQEAQKVGKIEGPVDCRHDLGD